MKIACIGARGYPVSYASAEDMVREFGPRFVRDGHEFTVHGWATKNTIKNNINYDKYKEIKRVFHKTPGGKISGQFFVALKASIHAAFSDSDIIFYIFVNSAIFSWIPRLSGKKIFINIDGIMWKDPKWPWGIRHIFFPLASYLSIFLGKAITDSLNMKNLYKKKFGVNIDWAGYGCEKNKPEIEEFDFGRQFDNGYYIVMSRITPHNLTDIIVDGFIQSNTKSHLVIAGHTPNSIWFNNLNKRANGKNVTFLGLVENQTFLTQLLLHAKAYIHGHSLGGINPALVRVTGMSVPAICVDTVFNREVVESPNNKLQALLFSKSSKSVAESIKKYEGDEELYNKMAIELGKVIRETMNWEIIYQQYKKYMKELL